MIASVSSAAPTSPASRSALARASTTTSPRPSSASSSSRLFGSCEPIATTSAWLATSSPLKSGSADVVQQQMMSAASTRSSTSNGSLSRPTMS